MPPGISDERVPGGAAVSRAPLLPVGWKVCLDNFHHPGDIMKPNERNTVAVLVATAHRSGRRGAPGAGARRCESAHGLRDAEPNL